MATPAPSGALWQLRLNYAMSGQRLLNTLTYQQEGTVPDFRTAGDLLLADAQRANGLIENILDCLSDDVTLTNIQAQMLLPTRQAAQRVNINLSGEQDEGTLPVNCAQVIERRGDAANRRNVGSFHLPPPSAAVLDSERWNAVQLTRLQEVANLLTSAIIIAVPVLAFFPVLLPKPLSSNLVPVTQAEVKINPRVMRRRTVGVGE